MTRLFERGNKKKSKVIYANNLKIITYNEEEYFKQDWKFVGEHPKEIILLKEGKDILIYLNLLVYYIHSCHINSKKMKTEIEDVLIKYNRL